MTSRLVLLALTLAMLPAHLGAQLAGLGGAVAEADMLYLAGEAKLSFERLDAYLETDSTDYGALWRAARAAVVLGIAEQGSRQQNAWLDPAILLANRAVELRPAEIDGIYWRGVASGRRAMNAGPRYAVELAEVVHDDAHAILAIDSLHGGAHNMLGKLNYEVMSLSRVKRLVARTFMGNEALDDTSWENAERHLRTAAEAWPDFVLFHFDLGQLYRKRGRREEAAREFAHALALPVVHPTDLGLQMEANEFLEEWGIVADSLYAGVTTDHAGDDAPMGR